MNTVHLSHGWLARALGGWLARWLVRWLAGWRAGWRAAPRAAARRSTGAGWLLWLACPAAVAAVPAGLPGMPASGPVLSAALAAGDGSGDLFEAYYDAGTWTGDVIRRGAAGQPRWSAAAALPVPDARRLFTAPASATLPQAVPVDAVLAPAVATRVRAAPLGGIVHGAPVLVAGPAARADTALHAAFNARIAARPALVYVAAADGLLHGFDAATGVEQLAWLPAALVARMGGAGAPPVLLDGAPAAGDALTAAGWRSLIVGGYGLALPGVYALDVTDPAMPGGEPWRFDAGTGHVRTAPVFMRLAGSGQGTLRDFTAIPTGADAPAAGMFLLALDRPEGAAWQLGDTYFFLPLGAAGTMPTAPGLVVGADGAVQLAYVGDSAGHLWRVDLRAGPPWAHAVTLLFTARDADGAPQPITAAPAVVYAPGGGYLILFGTGRWLDEQDARAGAAPQTIYAVRDDLLPRRAPLTRADLAPRRLTAAGAGYAIGGAALDWSQAAGWRLDLDHAERTGERIVTTPQVRDGVAMFGSLLPPAGNRVYVIDALTGLAAGGTTGRAFASANPAVPMLVAAGPVSERPRAGGGTRLTSTYTVTAPGHPDAPESFTVTVAARRLSWREIPNWRELHRAVQPEPP